MAIFHGDHHGPMNHISVMGWSFNLWELRGIGCPNAVGQYGKMMMNFIYQINSNMIYIYGFRYTYIIQFYIAIIIISIQIFFIWYWSRLYAHFETWGSPLRHFLIQPPTSTEVKESTVFSFVTVEKKHLFCPKNHGISKLVAWRSQNPAENMGQTPP